MRTPALFDAAGDVRAAYDEVDWAATPVGPPEQWSAELRAAVRLVLQTRFAATLLWGPDLVLIYNAPYVDLIGDKHPAALGRRAEDVFPEAWDQIGPMLEDVMDGGGATWFEDALLPLKRHGFLEDCYFTFSYSPASGEDGQVQGVIDITAETTVEVVSRRRLELLASLRDTLAAIESGLDLPSRAMEILKQYPEDLPAFDLRRSTDPDEPGEPGGLGGSGASDADDRATTALELLAQDVSGHLVAPPLDPADRDPAGPGWLPDRPGTPITASTNLLVESTAHGTVVWLPLATVRSPEHPSLLAVRTNPGLALDESYLQFLRLLAATLAQSFGRIEVLADERLVARTERAISEALQTSLLGEPLGTPGLEVAARYLPAASLSKIGGDWYDTFCGPDGALHLVLGDVAGHDRQAAVRMAQARNIMRGIAYTLDLSPARTMEAFDRALGGLDEECLLSAILARAVGADGDAEGDGDGDDAVHLTWSNAGHPPPVLLSPDGHARLLDEVHGALIGVDPQQVRREQTITLRPGTTVVLYTDGLVERRGEVFDAGLERLRSALERLGPGLTPEQVAEGLLAEVGASTEDDTALLVLRVAP